VVNKSCACINRNQNVNLPRPVAETFVETTEDRGFKCEKCITQRLLMIATPA